MLEIFARGVVYLFLGFLVVGGIVCFSGVAAYLFWCMMPPLSREKVVREWDSWIERTEEKTSD